jgi:hypothetical protein
MAVWRGFGCEALIKPQGEAYIKGEAYIIVKRQAQAG